MVTAAIAAGEPYRIARDTAALGRSAEEGVYCRRLWNLNTKGAMAGHGWRGRRLECGGSLPPASKSLILRGVSEKRFGHKSRQ